ncbi:MAG: NAD-binding protein, partial [Candidatus Dormibacteraceae bacterium]
MKVFDTLPEYDTVDKMGRWTTPANSSDVVHSGASTGHTIICGLEGLGLRVAESLIKLNERVTIVAHHPDPRWLRRARRAGSKVVAGRTDQLLDLSGLELDRARCLVLTDNSDLENLHMAMAARDVNPDIHLVIRMFSPELARQTSQLLTNSRTVS